MIDTVSIPVSACLARAGRFLQTMLLSLDASSRRAHEVVLVTEDDPVKLTQLALPWKGKTRLQVVGATPLPQADRDPAYRFGHNPVYQFLNLGVLNASEPWIMLPAGDDSYFPPEWEKLLNAVNPSRADREIWVPRYMSVQVSPSAPPTVRPCEYAIPSPEPIRETDLVRAVEGWRSSETPREISGKRELVSWVHAILHKDLFERAGRYQEVPPHPDSHDLHLNDALRDRFGVISVGVHSSVIVNARAGVLLGA